MYFKHLYLNVEQAADFLGINFLISKMITMLPLLFTPPPCCVNKEVMYTKVAGCLH